MTFYKKANPALRTRLGFRGLLSLVTLVGAALLVSRTCAAAALDASPAADGKNGSTLIRFPTLRYSLGHEPAWSTGVATFESMAAESSTETGEPKSVDAEAAAVNESLALADAGDVALIAPPLGPPQPGTAPSPSAVGTRTAPAAHLADGPNSSAPVPEPESLLLIGVASLGLYLVGRHWSRPH